MKKSAGILLYKIENDILKFFLVHPGGPYFKNKEDGYWTIPKGEFKENEIPFEAALREFYEETGTQLNGDFIELTPVKQKNRKLVFAWALEGEIEAENIVSNAFEMVWPPKSGKIQSFPEIDKGAWFDYETSIIKINSAQIELINELIITINKL